MLPQNISAQELLLQIRHPMRMGDVETVFQLLSLSRRPEAIEFCLTYKIHLERFQRGDLDTEKWCQEQIHNFDQVLKWLNFNRYSIVESGTFSSKVLLRLVNNQELDKALIHCEYLGDSSILMQARYNLFEKKFDQGLIELETWELVRNSTQHQLWMLGQSNASSKHSRRSFRESIKKWMQNNFR